ncbi:DUF7287 family protein [Natrarchaeobaculum sulfurireducens]|uniref:Pilin/flagellin n=1 Tax=Natrarchaeobaculum sulfurireducens TaxID=2044521 RepID=A0A346PGD2_9EURY|nr:hypothetical protein [Natrarchaeobaculum sulfurireducens]AXR78577.1 Pilin/flagellin [Natrarchaeobaculum sulfurireducens]
MTRQSTSGHDDGLRRRRTIAVGLDERAQTTQDFAIGIGIFILAVAFVFAFLPSMLTPYDSSVGGAETAQADRIADRIVADASSGTANDLDKTAFKALDDNPSDELGIRADDAGHEFDRVNVTVQELEENETRSVDDDLALGPEYDSQAAASAARTVTVDEYETECDPACRLVVRVW